MKLTKSFHLGTAAFALLLAMTARAAAAEQGAADPGHTTWMLVSSALVLFMTAPGLAMFYSGLVRRKNVLGVMMQCLFLMGLMTIVWAVWGYSLAFGGSGLWIGNADHLFLNGLTISTAAVGLLP